MEDVTNKLLNFVYFFNIKVNFIVIHYEINFYIKAAHLGIYYWSIN